MRFCPDAIGGRSNPPDWIIIDNEAISFHGALPAMCVCALSGTLTPSVVRLQQLLKNVRDKDILSSQLLKEAFLVCRERGGGNISSKVPRV
jgi:hypothetical protein